jgi:ATP-binding cassette subfamily F protein uup
LPAQIAAFATEKAQLEATLADRALYARDRAAFAASTGRHAALVEALARAEERWLELAALAEELSRASR